MKDEKRDDEPRNRDSWTEVERARPDMVEVEPIRHGMALAGRYVVEAIIGRGGMGLVVRAHDRTLGETVAIKIVRAEYTGQTIWAQRLAREVKLARQLHHPNVCRVFDFEQADGRVFLVMELATQETLRDEIAAGLTRARPLGETLADVRAVAAGLAAIHDAGIVHRDISPQNLLRMGDGRLVLSDFGLATDPSESTTSLRGGTIAYMAPEIVRGGRAGFASDIWALGVVVHEAVFGDKPTWRGNRRAEIVAPELGRPLSRAERGILEVCRACTAAEPERRPASAAAVAARLTEAALGRRDWRRLGVRAGVALCAAAVVMAAPSVVKRLRRRSPASVATAVKPASPLLEIVGEPEDWTDKSRVLGEVPDYLRCVVPLPDHHTVRFVWGRPPHAEDIDTKTGQRVPSPVVPAAYAEGCPDLSADGKRLVYQGHTPDGRAFAFVAENAEGRDAVPVAATAEPTYLSEPRWLPDSRTFSYDVDMRHVSVFSMATNRSTIIATVDEAASGTFFRWTDANAVVVGESRKHRETEFVGLDASSLVEVVRFRIPDWAMYLAAETSGRYLGITIGSGRTHGVFEADLSRHTARRVGFLAGQEPRSLQRVDGGWFFASRHETALLTLPSGAGRQADPVRVDALVKTAAVCGPGILSAEVEDGKSLIVQRSRTGEMVRHLTDGPDDDSVSCAADGRWFYVHTVGPESTIVQCDVTGCRDLMRGKAWQARVSQDGSKLVLLSVEVRGPTVTWIDVADPHRVHFVLESETICPPTWASERTVWVSRRRGAAPIWVEVDILTGMETGRHLPGTTDCSNGALDPSSPGDAKLTSDVVTQLRVISADAIGH